MGEVRDRIESVYASLSEPDFSFVAQALAARPYDRLVDSIRSDFELFETTDEEEDHAFMYALDRDGREWVMCISMVGPYVVFARTNPDQSWSKILDHATPDLSGHERAVVNKLTDAGLRLLGREQLEEPIPLRLFIAEPQNVRIFQALFTDTDILPWDIGTLRDVGAI